jgi:hypothetical protein
VPSLANFGTLNRVELVEGSMISRVKSGLITCHDDRLSERREGELYKGKISVSRTTELY